MLLIFPVSDCLKMKTIYQSTDIQKNVYEIKDKKGILRLFQLRKFNLIQIMLRCRIFPDKVLLIFVRASDIPRGRGATNFK